MGLLNMRSLFAITLLGAFVAASDVEFIQHISEQGLSYGTMEEFNFRKALF